MLKLLKSVIPMSLLVCSSLLHASENEVGKNDLEPCMNGEVSAIGAFPSDVAERQFFVDAAQEPCMHGDVPPDGVFAENLSGETVEQLRTAGTP